jgi:hypothetical protein
MGAVEIISAVAAGATTVLSNDGIQKMLCGTYSDGKTRNLPDAVTGEFLSPEQKKNILHGEDSSKKKKKKKKKGKGKKKKNKDRSVKFRL